MNRATLWLETRQLLADWFVPVSILLVIVALTSGFAAYSAVATPDEPPEYDTVESWSTAVDFSHSATVTEPNELYSVGQQLDDQPRYYTEVMPVLDGDIQYSYQASSGEVDIETEITQLTRAVEDGSDGEVTYWRDEQHLDSEQASGLSPGETHTASFAVDVTEMEQTAVETAESLGSTAGTLETVVEVEIQMNGTIDGEPVEHTEQYELPLDVTSGTYTIEPPSETGHAEQETVAASTDWSDRMGGAVWVFVLLLFSVGSLGGLVAAKHTERLAPSAADRQAVEAKRERESLDEWISRGVLPPAVSERPRIDVASLTELVDVAIDCNRRVIDRENADEYVVVDDTVLYGFVPERSESETAHNQPPADEDNNTPTDTTDADTPVSTENSPSADDTPTDES